MPHARTRTTARWTLAVLVVSGLALGAGACASSPTPVALDSVGRVDGSAALVAVIADGDQVSAYVCDGDTALAERFAGRIDGDHAELRSDDGARLSLDLTPGTSTGTFTPAGGTAHAFSTVAAATDESGWFTAEGATVTGAFSAGWIELADGTQTGVTTRDGNSGRRHRDRAPRLHHHRVPAPNGNPGPLPPRPATDAPSIAGLDDFDGPTRTLDDGPVRGPGGPGALTAAPQPTADDQPAAAGGQLVELNGGGGRPQPADGGKEIAGLDNGDSRPAGDDKVIAELDAPRRTADGGGPPAEVPGTVDAPEATVAGVGTVTPQRVGTASLARR